VYAFAVPTLEPWRQTRDPLSDFARRTLSLEGESRDVFVAGTGPAVIVISEIPGITPEVARFARWVRDAGFSVYMPVLFGDPGRPASFPYMLRTIARSCVRREFRALAANVTSPITTWMRALARQAHQERGGKGVGAVGMCFTGNFALSMMLEPSMLAPVLCQPSLPLGRKGGVHTSPEDLGTIRARMERDDLVGLAYRFDGDMACRKERWDDYERALGDRMRLRTLPDACANPAAIGGNRNPHSVVTNHLIDEAGQPTRAAVDEILALFRERLL
jgi:dienelactone hydrolase